MLLNFKRLCKLFYLEKIYNKCGFKKLNKFNYVCKFVNFNLFCLDK